MKSEYNELLNKLNQQLDVVTEKLAQCELNENLWPDPSFNIYQSYKEQDIKGKRDIISLFKLTSINPVVINLNPLEIDDVISLIVQCHT